jgi:hypothetical protein
MLIARRAPFGQKEVLSVMIASFPLADALTVGAAVAAPAVVKKFTMVRDSPPGHLRPPPRKDERCLDRRFRVPLGGRASGFDFDPEGRPRNHPSYCRPQRNLSVFALVLGDQPDELEPDIFLRFVCRRDASPDRRSQGEKLRLLIE